MKNLFLALFVLVGMSSVCVADDNSLQDMKQLTINALMGYGVSVYDRGNTTEAKAVFQRVLTYDPNHPQALRYMHQMGVIAQNPKPKPAVHTGQPKVLAKTIISPAVFPLQAPPVYVTASGVNVTDKEDLKQAIKDKDEQLKELTDQVARLRAAQALDEEDPDWDHMRDDSIVYLKGRVRGIMNNPEWTGNTEQDVEGIQEQLTALRAAIQQKSNEMKALEQQLN